MALRWPPPLPPDCEPNYRPRADWTDYVAHPQEAKQWRSKWGKKKGKRALVKQGGELFGKGQ